MNLSQKRRQLLPYIAIALLLLGGAAITESLQKVVTDRTFQLQRTEALGVISQLRAQLESEINSVLYLSSGLISYVTVQPRTDQQQWNALAAEIVRGTEHVRNIGLAPDNVIRFVYPLHGNEAALGLEYEQNPKQWPAVKQAIDKGGMVLAGPLTLVQGGLGLIARTPIFTHGDSEQTSRYWGLASVVIDAESMFRSAGIKDQVSGYRVAIKGRDGLGEQGEMVYGAEEVFTQGIAKMKIFFPNGHWVIAALPDSTVGSYWMGPQVARVVGYSFLAVLSVLLVILVRLYHASKGEAMHDHLTGLPNRRLMIERLTQLAVLNERTEINFALYFIDLNGFKAINDNYGHVAGDAVLVEVGRRLIHTVRSSDTVARTGGDEFMVLQPGVKSVVAAKTVVEKIEAALRAPFQYQYVTIDISAAIGVAIYPKDTATVDKLIMVADDRMYERKAEMKSAAVVSENLVD
ncbi:diguanylate cyclase domain-containing protein [Marinobacterium zhoushanense]|uniref:diguanylate cyclase domain-containing protein n=1 Tax=Marinobacterium zhoushanense TaxID=1679163 RepID=UPI00166D296F|nr:diguanylate cyclase [Marinobacterium zhoushanense]